MSFFNHLLTHVLNFLLPPTCPVCRCRTMSAHALCPDCYAQVRFITDPCCSVCGRPFEIKIFGDMQCGMCLKKRPLYRAARAAFVYDDFSKQLILPFKHADKIESVTLLCNILLQAGRDVLAETDVIVPVPLHQLRLMKRKYNQAALLAQQLAVRTGKSYAPTALKRIKHTKSQGHLKHSERKKNLAKAFAIGNANAIKGKNVLLVDDVMTTGTTVHGCIRVLLKHGANSVSVLTLARVLKE